MLQPSLTFQYEFKYFFKYNIRDSAVLHYTYYFVALITLNIIKVEKFKRTILMIITKLIN